MRTSMTPRPRSSARSSAGCSTAMGSGDRAISARTNSVRMAVGELRD
jgi:hypothetical protein